MKVHICMQVVQKMENRRDWRIRKKTWIFASPCHGIEGFEVVYRDAQERLMEKEY